MRAFFCAMQLGSTVPRAMPTAVSLSTSAGSDNIRGEIVTIAIVPAGIIFYLYLASACSLIWREIVTIAVEPAGIISVA